MVKTRFPSKVAILYLDCISIYSEFKIFSVNLLANNHVATCARSLFIFLQDYIARM